MLTQLLAAGKLVYSPVLGLLNWVELPEPVLSVFTVFGALESVTGLVGFRLIVASSSVLPLLLSFSSYSPKSSSSLPERFSPSHSGFSSYSFFEST